jgi:hypothetical protein
MNRPRTHPKRDVLPKVPCIECGRMTTPMRNDGHLCSSHCKNEYRRKHPTRNSL